MNINHDNIEAYIIDYIDGELDDATSTAVLDFIQLHPTYQTMLDEYKQTIMCEEPLPAHITFDKSTLYKSEENDHIVAFKPKYQWKNAVAAILVLGIMVPFLWPKSVTNDIETNDTISTISTTTQHEPVHTTPSQTAAITTHTNVTIAAPKMIALATHDTESKNNTKKALDTRIDEDDISYIANQALATIDIDLKAKELMAPVASIPEPIQVNNQNKLSEYFNVNLPIDDMKAEGVALIEKINKAKELINNTTIIAKIGNKQFKIK